MTGKGVVTSWVELVPSHLRGRQEAAAVRVLGCLGKHKISNSCACPRSPRVPDSLRGGFSLCGRHRLVATSVHAGARFGDQELHEPEANSSDQNQGARVAFDDHAEYRSHAEKEGGCETQAGGDRANVVCAEDVDVDAMELLQRGLMRRIKTLEIRGDWRGVLAAMVRTIDANATQPPFMHLTGSCRKQEFRGTICSGKAV